MSEDVIKMLTYNFDLKYYIYAKKRITNRRENIYDYIYKNVRCEVLMTVNLNITLFCDVTRCSLADTEEMFAGSRLFLLQSALL
jgi:hypothetical protein